MTGYYLLDTPNPACPDRGDGQYHGYMEMQAQPYLIAVHTTESFADELGDDMGAENVAAYFSRSTTAASYHTIVDSDSTVRCLPAGLDGTTVHTAFHCYGRNTGNLGVSFAMRAAEWETVSEAWKTAALTRAADEVALWCRRWDIPARLVDRDQADAGVSGITGHGILQPEDRTDPGAATVFAPSLFPWDRFLAMVNERLGGVPGVPPAADEECEMRACKMNDGQILLVDGMEFRVMPGSWDEINATLIELARAGLIPCSADGVPTLEAIGDNAVNALRKVG